MPTAPTSCLLPATLIAALLLSFPIDASACSKMAYRTVASPGTSHFIAVATPDTVLAGAGAVEYRVAPGHFGPATERSIHGQVVELKRTGGPAAERLEGHTHALLVPWDYGSDCVPTPWANSARWVDLGEPGLFIADLRDAEFWAGDLPTFDIHVPQYQPFRHRPEDRRTPRDAEAMTMDELFSLYDVLPVARPGVSPDEAIRPLLAWARQNPELAGRHPAWSVLGINLYSAESARIRALESPIAGTYRLTLHVPGRSPETIFLRTARHPNSGWSRRPVDADSQSIARPSYVGYHLSAVVARELEDLPSGMTESGESIGRGYIAVEQEGSPRATAGERVWRGEIELLMFARAFPDDPELQRVQALDWARYRARSRAGLPPEARARFTLEPDGSLRVRQVTELEDGSRLTLAGERVSDTTLETGPRP